MEVKRSGVPYQLDEMSIEELQSFELIIKNDITDIEFQLEEQKRLYSEGQPTKPYEWSNKARAALKYKQNLLKPIAFYMEKHKRDRGAASLRIKETLNLVWDTANNCITFGHYQWLIDQMVLELSDTLDDYNSWVIAYEHEKEPWSTGEEP